MMPERRWVEGFIPRFRDEPRVKGCAASWGSWCALGSVLGVVDPGAKSRALGLQALSHSFAPLRA
jgi:hypothetical protein